MFPLKTLVVAVVIAIVFGPRVSACPAHNHEQTVMAPAATEQQVTTVATSAAPQATKPSTAKPADVASGPATAPAAN